MTPPLLPLSPPFLPVEPAIDIQSLELPGGYSSPTNQQVFEVERLLYTEDAIVSKKMKLAASLEDPEPVSFGIDSVGEFYSPLRGVQDPQPSPPIKREAFQDRKVEEPLTPPPLERRLPSEAKSTSVHEALLEIIPDLPSIIANNGEMSSDEVDVFCDEIFAPIGIKVERCIEQEQLQAADTEQRVPIPIMDFSRPLPPWKVPISPSAAASNNQKFLSDLKKNHLSKHVWPVIGKSERELRWNPFLAAMEDIEAQESFIDDGSKGDFLSQPECVDSESLTWKPEGLRILDQPPEFEYEEIEVGQLPDAKDMNSLIRRRKYEMLDDNEEGSETVASKFCAKRIMLESDQSVMQSVAKALPQGVAAYSQRETEEPKNLIPERFSALSALENFICIRNGESRKPTLTAEKYFSDRSTEASHRIASLKEPSLKPIIGINKKTRVKMPPFPVPQFIVPSTPHIFVVSTSFIRNRKLARSVQQLYPVATFIERDFALHSSSSMRNDSQLRNGKGLQSKLLLAETTMADEADMILSPGIGLIWTTLQRIKQRPLPGQTTRSTVRDSIIRAAPRYERLLVLISGGSSDDTDECPEDNINDVSLEDLITDSDCEALAEFMGICSALHGDTQALFVPGGDQQLSQWIVAMMVKHGATEAGKMKLLQDETLWEIFLRRVGLNAFAAQAVLSELKAPNPNSEHGGANVREVEFELGLTAFVKMSLEERLRRFEGLLGGRGLLIRVSDRLDSRWL